MIYVSLHHPDPGISLERMARSIAALACWEHQYMQVLSSFVHHLSTSPALSSLLLVRHGYDIRSPLVSWWRGRSGVQSRLQEACDIRRACRRRGWNADMRSRCTWIRDSLISC